MFFTLGSLKLEGSKELKTRKLAGSEKLETRKLESSKTLEIIDLLQHMLLVQPLFWCLQRPRNNLNDHPVNSARRILGAGPEIWYLSLLSMFSMRLFSRLNNVGTEHDDDDVNNANQFRATTPKIGIGCEDNFAIYNTVYCKLNEPAPCVVKEGTNSRNPRSSLDTWLFKWEWRESLKRGSHNLPKTKKVLVQNPTADI